MARDRKNIAEQAEQELAAAQAASGDALPDRAIDAASRAMTFALAADVPEIFVRACVVTSQAFSNKGELKHASFWAMLGEDWAAARCPRTQDHAWATLQLFETCEIRGMLEIAHDGFVDVARGVDLRPGWQSDIHLNIANHRISLGLKLARDDLIREGIAHGESAANGAATPDERASFEQWRAISETASGRPDAALERLEASFADRSKSRKRNMTKKFPLGQAHLELGNEAEGLRLIDHGIAEAEEGGMQRYVAAGKSIRQGFVAA